MKGEDTVVAQATPYGLSSVSVIRISGEISLKIANKITKKKRALVNRVATLRSIYLPTNKKIDSSIFLYFKNPTLTQEKMLSKFHVMATLLLWTLL